jgi:hypothetical protein
VRVNESRGVGESGVEGSVNVADCWVDCRWEDIARCQNSKQPVAEVEGSCLQVLPETTVRIHFHSQVVLDLTQSDRIQVRLILDRCQEVDDVLTSLQLTLVQFNPIRTEHEEGNLPVGAKIVVEIVVRTLVRAIRLNGGASTDSVEVDEEVLPVFSTYWIPAANKSEETFLNLLIGLDVASAGGRLGVVRS